MKYDNPLKEILQDAMPALLRLLKLPGVARSLNVELPRLNRVVPDLVFELVDESVLHIDAQAKNQAQFEWRCLDYYSAIQQQYWPPEIVQVVIYLGDEPLRIPAKISHRRLTYQYEILELAKVPARTFLESPADAERILAVLCQSTDPRETIREILGGWKHLPRKRIEELMERLSALSLLRKCDTIAIEEIERMPIEIDITESAFFKRGEATGQARGEAVGEAKILIRILETRFGQLDDATRNTIQAASVEQLDQWVDRALTASNLEDVL